MASRGQYWTEAQRSATEGKAYWVERVALLYTVILATWLHHSQCNPPQQDNINNCRMMAKWLFALMVAFGTGPLCYSCDFLFKTELLSSRLTKRIFRDERLLLLLSLALVPKGTPLFFLTLILLVLSLLVCGIYFVCFLDRFSYLSWFMRDYNQEIGNNVGTIEELRGGDDSGIIAGTSEEEEEEIDHDNVISEEEEEEIDHDNGTSIYYEDEEWRRNMKRLEEFETSCEVAMAEWEAKIEKLEDKWLRMVHDAVIAADEKQQRAEDAHQQDRRKWEEEKAQLSARLSDALASAQLYRNLLHES